MNLRKIKKHFLFGQRGLLLVLILNKLNNIKHYLTEAFSENHLILFGSNTIQKNVNTLDTFNSLIIVNNKLDIIFQYDKIKLVPFGEVLPYEKILSKIGLKKITEGYGSFSRGTTAMIFSYLDNLKMLPLICYEIIFPEIKSNSKKFNYKYFRRCLVWRHHRS